jgi:hypothetical protein
MSRAIGMTLVLALVVLLGTHPGSVANLVHEFLGVLQRAGNELSAFVNRL